MSFTNKKKQSTICRKENIERIHLHVDTHINCNCTLIVH